MSEYDIVIPLNAYTEDTEACLSRFYGPESYTYILTLGKTVYTIVKYSEHGKTDEGSTLRYNSVRSALETASRNISVRGRRGLLKDFGYFAQLSPYVIVSSGMRVVQIPIEALYADVEKNGTRRYDPFADRIDEDYLVGPSIKPHMRPEEYMDTL